MAVAIKKSGTVYQLPVTPMVDLVFNLLLFFVVATKFAEVERELDVALPDASEAKPIVAELPELVVNIDKEGHYFIGNQAVPGDQLLTMLKRTRANNPDRAAVSIRADRHCQWESVVGAMNMCTKAKIPKYRVTTRDAAG